MSSPRTRQDAALQIMIQEVTPLVEETKKATAALVEANRALHEDLPGELATAFRAGTDYWRREMGDFRTSLVALAENVRLFRDAHDVLARDGKQREGRAALLGLVIGLALGALAAWVAIRW